MKGGKPAEGVAPQRLFKTYPAYKDSGIEWLGEIPAGWDVERLKHAARLHGSVSANASDCDGGEGDVCYVSPEELIEGSARQATSRWLSPTTAKEYDIVPADSTAICTIASLGQSCQFTRPFVTNPQVKGLSARAHVESRFLALVLLAARAEVKRLSTVSVVPFINGWSLLELRVPRLLPREQRAIAGFLDRETARIDALVAKKERLIELLQEQRTALITRAVTTGLDPNVPMKDSGVEWLGAIPAHWEIRPFTKYLAEKSDYRGKTPEKVASGIFLVTARNVRMGLIDYDCSEEFIAEQDYEEVMRRGAPRKGDILFTTEAPLGNVALVDREDVALAQRIIRFRMNPKHFDSRFTLFAMMSDSFQAQLVTLSTGSTAEGLKASKLPMLWLIAPPLTEQRVIAAFLDRETVRIDALVTKVGDAIDRLKELRVALIFAAVTGKIDVRGGAA